MASELFNSLSGYSVGIPPVQVINSSGNVVTNLNAPAANVTANTVYANIYRYANGAIFSSNAGGNNTQLQFNNNGVFAGIPNATWDGNTLSLGDVDNVAIFGGENGYFLQTDGAGNLTWSLGGGGGGNGSPAGANTQVQFNDAGGFGGDSGFTYNKTTNTLSVDNFSTAVANVGNITANYFIGNGSLITGIISETANFVVQPTQSNITSVGTLTGLTVSGNVNFLSKVNLGYVGNLKILGGSSGYVLKTDGTGNLSWQLSEASTAAGSNTQVQYNKDGQLAGSAFFSFSDSNNTVQVSGLLIANTAQVGSGAYKFSTSAIQFASSNTTDKQVIYTIPVSECSGVDFEIIGTDTIALTRHSSKITSLYYAGNVQYNEYAGLYINGGVGDFVVEYNAGNMLVSPSLDLLVTPNSNNFTVYKMLITILAP